MSIRKTRTPATVNPNKNCLHGTRCPNCGSFGPFEILISMRVLLFDEGTDDADDASVHFDNSSPARCHHCDFKGKFGNFKDAKIRP
jgi:hypothetical protein